MAHMAPLLRAGDATWTSYNGISLMQTDQALRSHEVAIQAEVARLTSSLHKSGLIKFMDFAANAHEPSTLVPYLFYGGAIVIMAVCVAAWSGHRRKEHMEDDDDSDMEKEEEAKVTQDLKDGEPEPRDSAAFMPACARPVPASRERHMRSCVSSVAAPRELTQATFWCLCVLVISSWLLLGFRSALEVLYGHFPMPFGVSWQLCDAICYSLAFAVEVAKPQVGNSFCRYHRAARLDILAGGLSVAVAFLAAVYNMAAVAEMLSRKGQPGGFGRHGKGAETNFLHAGAALLLCIGVREAMDVALLVMCHRHWPVSRTMFHFPTCSLPWELASEGKPLGFWVPRRTLETSKSVSTPDGVQKDVSVWDHCTLLWLYVCSKFKSTMGCASVKAPDGSVAITSTVEEFNMAGVLLHLLCGSFRGAVVILTGLLVWLGVLTDATKTDAVCALIVGVFVTGVVLVFLRKLLMTLARPWPRNI